MELLPLDAYDTVGIRAENPGPLTLSGTNSWIVGRGPAWLVDPGPSLPAHLDALAAELSRRGGLGGIVLTHDHFDHAEAVPKMRALYPDAPLAAGRGDVEVVLHEAVSVGPFHAVAVPGHAPDHFVLVAGAVAFTGDAVLGEGSVFIAPGPGAMSGYLRGLSKLRELAPEVIAPGHGPPVEQVDKKLEEYIDHRLERERRLVMALESGRRTVEELLAEVWDDAPSALRPAAALTLAAHLDKLDEEGRLPEGVERPRYWADWPAVEAGA